MEFSIFPFYKLSRTTITKVERIRSWIIYNVQTYLFAYSLPCMQSTLVRACMMAVGDVMAPLAVVYAMLTYLFYYPSYLADMHYFSFFRESTPLSKNSTDLSVFLPVYPSIKQQRSPAAVCYIVIVKKTITAFSSKRGLLLSVIILFAWQ